MKTTTAAYKRIIASGDSRKFLVNINMTLKDGTSLTLTEEDIWADSFSIDTASSGKSSLDIGYAVIGQCSFQIENFDERFNSYDFFNATAVVWVKLVGDTQYYRMGFFSVDEPNHVGVLISLKLLNNMWKFDDKNLSEVGLSFPCSCQTAITTVCAYCGVTLATSQFHGYQFTLTKAPEKDMNCRKFIQYVAMIGCNFCIIDDTGALRLKWYDVDAWVDDLDGGTFDTHTTPYSDGDTADGGNFLVYEETKDYDGGSFLENTTVAYFTRIFGTPQIGTDEITVTGVKIEIDETTYMVGTEGYVIDLKENPLLTPSNVNAALNLIWDVLRGFRFRTFDITTLPDLAVEIGDCCAIRDAHGNYVHSYITNNSFRFSDHQASLGAITPMRSLVKRYSETVQAAVEIARKKTDEAISNYDVAVQLMNSLAINAMGAYQDYEDILTGGRIYYLSNMPITKENGVCHFTPGSTVFMISGSGFFVSTQGGLPDTWDNGYDPETGALLVNILKAIGVEADWIQTGLLRDKDGYNYWDLDHNTFHLAGGTTVGDGDTTLDDFAVKDGTIVDVDVEYNKNQSSSTPPQQSDPNWSTNSPQWQVGYYIWQRTKTTDAEGTVYYSAPACIQGAKGETGADGDDGVGVSAIVEEYIITTSNTTKPSASDPGWSTNQPVWENGKYIWTRSKVTWTNNVITTTEPVLAQGINQANKKAYDTDNNLNQQGIYNRLTQNGKTLGIFLIQDPEYPSDPTKKLLYLNATYMTTGELADKTHTNYWNLDNGDLRMTAGAKIKIDYPDYSGAYVPSCSNSPASGWTTVSANANNIGKVFKDTSADKYYIYKPNPNNLPESEHPYGHGINITYRVRTYLPTPIKIKFSADCEVESGYDFLKLSYELDGVSYKRTFSGEFGGTEVIIPSDTFWLTFTSDSSVNKWGWKIESIEVTSGDPTGFTHETHLSADAEYWLYGWEEITIESLIQGTSQKIITDNMNQEEIFNALTGGGAVQGIYIYNGKVYLNASFMNIGEIDANLIKVGALNADIIRDGTLIMGGTNDFNGKILVLGNNTNLDSFTNIISATQYLGYAQTNKLGKFAITANLTGLPDDITLEYEVYLTTDGSNFNRVDGGEITPGASSFIYTYPPIFDINSTSGNRYYYISIYDQNMSRRFNVAFSFAPITSILDNDGINTTKLVAMEDCKFGNLEIGKKIIKPYGVDLEVSYVYAFGYKELFWNEWSTLSKNFNKTIYFSPYYDGWTSDVDVNISFDCYDTSSIDHERTQVCRVQLYRWTGSAWTSLGYRRLNCDGNELDDKDTYFSGLNKNDQNLYKLTVKISRYTWAEDYVIDIYTDKQHTIEIDPYETIGSFRGNFSGAAEFYALSVRDITFNPDGSILSDDDDTTAKYKIQYEGFSAQISNTQCVNLLCDSRVVVEVMKSSSEYIRINTTNPSINVYDSSSEYIDITTSKMRLQQDSSNYVYMSKTSISALWDGDSYYVDWVRGSDERIKDEIESLSVKLSKNLIDATEPKKFKYKSGGGKHYGMIAQQARKVLDSLGETDSVLEYGPNVENEDIPNYRAIHYEEYIPHIINYLQYLEKKTEEQETRISQLEEEIKLLKGVK